MPDIDVTNRVMLDGFSADEQRSLKLMLHRMRRTGHHLGNLSRHDRAVRDDLDIRLSVL